MTKMFTCSHFSFHSLFLTVCSVKSAVLLHPVVIGEREASRGKEKKCSEQNVKDSGEKQIPISYGKEHLVCLLRTFQLSSKRSSSSWLTLCGSCRFKLCVGVSLQSRWAHVSSGFQSRYGHLWVVDYCFHSLKVSRTQETMCPHFSGQRNLPRRQLSFQNPHDLWGLKVGRYWTETTAPLWLTCCHGDQAWISCRKWIDRWMNFDPRHGDLHMAGLAQRQEALKTTDGKFLHLWVHSNCKSENLKVIFSEHLRVCCASWLQSYSRFWIQSIIAEYSLAFCCFKMQSL